MVEVEQDHELTYVGLTLPERRLVAACVAAQVVAVAPHEERQLAELWTRIHPEGEV